MGVEHRAVFGKQPSINVTCDHCFLFHGTPWGSEVDIMCFVQGTQAKSEGTFSKGMQSSHTTAGCYVPATWVRLPCSLHCSVFSLISCNTEPRKSMSSGCLVAAHTRVSRFLTVYFAIKHVRKPSTPRQWQTGCGFSVLKVQGHTCRLWDRCLKLSEHGSRQKGSRLMEEEAFGSMNECVHFPGLSVLTMRKVARFKINKRLTHIYCLAPLTP